MTAARSHSTPDSAPSVIGTALPNELFNSPPKLSDLSAAPKVRNAKIKNPATRPRTRFVRRPKPRASCTPPAMAHTSASALSANPVPIFQSGNVTDAPPGARPNVVTCPGTACRAKNIQILKPITRNNSPITRWRVGDSRSISRRSAVVAMRYPPPQPFAKMVSSASAGALKR